MLIGNMLLMLSVHMAVHFFCQPLWRAVVRGRRCSRPGERLYGERLCGCLNYYFCVGVGLEGLYAIWSEVWFDAKLSVVL